MRALLSFAGAAARPAVPAAARAASAAGSGAPAAAELAVVAAVALAAALVALAGVVASARRTLPARRRKPAGGGGGEGGGEVGADDERDSLVGNGSSNSEGVERHAFAGEELSAARDRQPSVGKGWLWLGTAAAAALALWLTRSAWLITHELAEANAAGAGEGACEPPTDAAALLAAYRAPAGVHSWRARLGADAAAGAATVASRASEVASELFHAGLLFRMGFNLDEAQRAFGAALVLDPRCSLCAWGLAYAQGPTLNHKITAEGARVAAAAAKRASDFAATDTERAYAAAISARFGASWAGGNATLEREYEAAVERLAARFPADATAAALLAEAQLHPHSWAFYEGGYARPDARAYPDDGYASLRLYPSAAAGNATAHAAAELDEAHPLALHLLAHVYEMLPGGGTGIDTSASGRPTRPFALSVAQRLLAPPAMASHLTHMAGHVYLRAGLYAEANEANRRAIEADDALTAACLVPYAQLHNIASLQYGAALSAQPALALQRTQSLVQLDPWAFKLQAVHEYPTVLVAAHFGLWDVVAAEEAPKREYQPYTRAVGHYAKALAACAGCEVGACRESTAALRTAVHDMPSKGYEAGLTGTVDEGVFLEPHPFWPEHPRITRAFLLTATAALALAESAHRSGRCQSSAGAASGIDAFGGLAASAASDAAALATAEGALREAVTLQDATHYMEPEMWVASAKLCLGMAQLRAGDALGAADSFHHELFEHPNTPRALEGLRVALQAVRAPGAYGDDEVAARLPWLGSGSGDASSSFERHLPERLERAYALAESGQRPLQPCAEIPLLRL